MSYRITLTDAERDLALLEGLLAKTEAHLDKLREEVSLHVARSEDLRRQIAALRPTVPMTVKVSFGEP